MWIIPKGRAIVEYWPYNKNGIPKGAFLLNQQNSVCITDEHFGLSEKEWLETTWL